MNHRGTRPVVGLAYPLQFQDVAQVLEDGAEVVVAASTDADGIGAIAHGADAFLIRGPARLSAEIIDASPRLQAIVVTGSGTNHVDVAAATARGIPVTSGKGVAPQAVAEYVIGGLLAVRRRFFELDALLTSGSLDWGSRITTCASHEVMGSTLGLVGLGHIGRTVATIATRGLQMQVFAYDPMLPNGHPSVDATLVDDLDELFRVSDAVSVHVPLTPGTRGLVHRDRLRLLGPDGILVNTSRGGVVDEDALLELLRSGDLGGAVIDVFDEEPPDAVFLERLRATPNLIATPHVAGVTFQTRRQLELSAVEEILRVLRGEQPMHLVNPEVLLATPAEPSAIRLA